MADSRQAVHWVASQTAVITIRRTTRIWPQRMRVAGKVAPKRTKGSNSRNEQPNEDNKRMTLCPPWRTLSCKPEGYDQTICPMNRHGS